MKISDCMKRNVVSIQQGAAVSQVVDLVIENLIGTVPVVDSQGKLVGVVKLRDILSLVMPDFVRLIDNFDFVHDFGAVNSRQPTLKDLNEPVNAIMQEPIYAEADCSLLRAAALLNQHGLKDLPVVDSQGKLIGIASHVDIGVALMKKWNLAARSSGEQSLGK
ncbi:MAG: CBS domain-containing protein [Chloroflexi bacterium]|nr:CBS domain-containing protein [Anaerolineaceae bacterium]NMB90418.1 CBS domain-containing protein [Chloroflexota bacterium]